MSIIIKRKDNRVSPDALFYPTDNFFLKYKDGYLIESKKPENIKSWKYNQKNDEVTIKLKKVI
jgi:hypothetical protein